MTKLETIFKHWAESKGIIVLDTCYVGYARSLDVLLEDGEISAFRFVYMYAMVIEKYFNVSFGYYNSKKIFDADMQFKIAKRKMIECA
jgi:hypothetical protein